ncbi:MotA/TolQ/ExbB proton channel family protein [uncultured Flavobacterium sp.]|uniref:MotA/TolQ/ExbB proton channel family protein n=1 Tax=uncultured Flavobacterium sp. TaxID=165435 RepID=UPI0030EC0F16|tara:strand:- start:118636 stop:118983 length:348 start_codon:yes stop_codon:yes gene_type:complete
MILERINEGGPFFMMPILIILLLIIFLFVRGLIKKDANSKTIRLISSISLFVLVWGFLGQAIGLIGAFDAIESIGSISPEVLSSGLKISFLPLVFGMFTFLIARVGIIILTLLEK